MSHANRDRRNDLAARFSSTTVSPARDLRIYFRLLGLFPQIAKDNLWSLDAHQSALMLLFKDSYPASRGFT
jgi:hypothetical protein